MQTSALSKYISIALSPSLYIARLSSSLSATVSYCRPRSRSLITYAKSTRSRIPSSSSSSVRRGIIDISLSSSSLQTRTTLSCLLVTIRYTITYTSTLLYYRLLYTVARIRRTIGYILDVGAR